MHASHSARVVALPGWMHTHADFDAALDGLDAVAFDLHGFGGATPPPGEPWGSRDYANAIAPALVAPWFDESLVLVGHSRGGAIAVHLALAMPGRVSAMVLTGVPLLRRTDREGSKPALTFRVMRSLHRRGIVSDERMEAMRRKSGSADYRAATGVMRDILVRVTNETYEDELPRVQCPVELVWGAVDDQVPVDVAERAAALLPNATLTVLPGVGHLVPTHAPGALRAAIDKQLQ